MVGGRWWFSLHRKLKVALDACLIAVGGSLSGLNQPILYSQDNSMPGLTMKLAPKEPRTLIAQLQNIESNVKEASQTLEKTFRDASRQSLSSGYVRGVC